MATDNVPSIVDSVIESDSVHHWLKKTISLLKIYVPKENHSMVSELG